MRARSPKRTRSSVSWSRPVGDLSSSVAASTRSKTKTPRLRTRSSWSTTMTARSSTSRAIHVVRYVDGTGRGAAAARNRGVHAAGGSLIAFTDDDTIPTRGWVGALARASEATPEAAGFDGPVLVGDFDRLYFHAPIAAPGTCCGANVAYRKSTLDRTGGFDERFTGWMPEDIDLGLRARHVGPVEYVPEMIVEHPPRPVAFRELVFQSRNVEGQWLLFRKHPSLSRWRTPLRWAPAVHAFRHWIRFLGQPEVVRRSPLRAAAHRGARGGVGSSGAGRGVAAMAGARMTAIDVVVPSYARPVLLERCLAALAIQTVSPRAIVVVARREDARPRGRPRARRLDRSTPCRSMRPAWLPRCAQEWEPRPQTRWPSPTTTRSRRRIGWLVWRSISRAPASVASAAAITLPAKPCRPGRSWGGTTRSDVRSATITLASDPPAQSRSSRA